MSEALSVTKAAFGGLREVTASPLWQYDYGQILQITGLDLPRAFEVHFSNSRKSGETITQIGTDSQVVIPDMYLTSGADIYAFVFLHDGLTDGETEYVIKIPVRERPEPSDIEPTPEQQDAITEAIAALNVAVTQTGQDVISADASAQAAAQSATEAQTAARSAQGSATSASASATTASTAASTATQKAGEAATSAANAASAKTAAEIAEASAQAAKTASESARASAESAAMTAMAEASDAEEFATSASGSATAASASASQASGSATSAANSATAASGSATAAATSASTASTKASEASTSATEANTAKTAAQAAQTAAETAAATFETDTTLTVSGKAADAKAVGDEISDIKRELTNAENAIVTGSDSLIPLVWHAGSLNTSTGAEETGTRQRSDFYAITQASFKVSFASPITDCMVFWYDENKEYKSRTGWQSNGATVANANAYFRIMARKRGSSQLTDAEIKSFKAVTNPIWKDTDSVLDARISNVEPVLSAFAVGNELLTIDGKFINSNGNEQSYSTSSSIHYYATDFFDVSLCKQVKVKTCLGTGSTIAVYNGAKQKTRVITTQGSSAVYDYNITLENGEKYIRSSFQELTGYTTKDQFYLIAYKNVLLAFESISENGGESNNAVERAQLKPLLMPTVVFVDDDGSSSLWDTTVPIFETAGIPLTIAVGKDSDIMSDLSTLRTWLSTAGHDMVQHSLGSDQDLSAKTYTELTSWIESEQAFFYNNGFVVTNIVYGGSQWSEQMLRVIERYYNSGCTIPNSQMGISYGYNNPGTSRYKLARYAVSNWTSTSGHSLQDCKDIFDEFLATGQNGIIIFYSHSYQLVDNQDRVQILTDFIDYVKAAQTRGDCTISTLSAVFG